MILVSEKGYDLGVIEGLRSLNVVLEKFSLFSF